jgi:hypothetical protein
MIVPLVVELGLHRVEKIMIENRSMRPRFEAPALFAGKLFEQAFRCEPLRPPLLATADVPARAGIIPAPVF